jgi:ribosome assembly protein 1
VHADSLYLFVCRDLVPLTLAGAVVGIGGLGVHILKSATLCSLPACPPLSALSTLAEPIVRVFVEPEHPSELAALVRGLQMLAHADPCVQVTVQVRADFCAYSRAHRPVVSKY